MNIKRALLILLIVVAVISSVGAVSAGLFDGLLGQTQDNVVEIENITFNTTNATEWEYVGDDGQGWVAYMTKDNISACAIMNGSDLSDSQYDFEVNELKDIMATYYTVQKVNGIDVYTLNDVDGNDTEFYYAFVINDDLKTAVQLNSITPNETAYMASTLEFK